MIEGAIFDFDGTLVDSMFIWDTVCEDYLKLYGIEPKENLAERFKTFTLEQSAEYYRNHYNIRLTVKEIINEINDMVTEIYRTKVALKPGISDFLKSLYSSGVKMCVATVTDKAIVKDVLKRLNIYKYFSGIFTCNEVGYNKETPEIYRHALKHLKTDKNATIVFEDSFHALKTAKDDGFKVAGVYDSHELKQEEIKKLSDYYITDFGDFCIKTKMKTVLSVAGSDSSGCAGIQADIKTITMNGVYAMSVITSLTAQNTLGVRAISDSSPEFLKAQLDAVFEDIFPDSVKVGMVSSGELINVIAERLKYYNAENIVVDPVMVTSSGSSLIKSDAINALTEKLLPLATLVTPNIPEAEVLSGIKIKNKDDIVKAAVFIKKNYGCDVLLKGGHSINDANDLLCYENKIIWFKGKRINNPNTHGTGCTLSSAVAANLAKGYDLPESIKKAKDYISNALSAGLDLGKGSGPLKHNFIINSKV